MVVGCKKQSNDFNFRDIVSNQIKNKIDNKSVFLRFVSREVLQ